MNQRIPAGVVTTTDGLTTELQRSEAVDPSDIAQLWKVYTTQSSKIPDAVARRLENLFWRLWADPRLHKQRLSGVTLAALFMAIHESSPVLSAPPVSKTTDLSKPNDTAQVTIVAITHEQRDGPGPRPGIGSRKGSKSPLPPILKNAAGPKSQPPSEPSSYKTARIVIPDQPKKNAGTGAGQMKPAVGAASKQTRKRPSFVANTSASSRRRGVVMRRKSPLTTSTVEMEGDPFPAETEQASKTEAEGAEEETVTESTQDRSNVSENPEIPWRSLSYLKPSQCDRDTTTYATTTQQTSLAASPSSPPPANFSVSSVAHHRSLNDADLAQTAAAAAAVLNIVKSSTNTSTNPTSTIALVDRDFRTSFVERKRQESIGSKTKVVASSLTSNLSTSQFKDLLTTDTIPIDTDQSSPTKPNANSPRKQRNSSSSTNSTNSPAPMAISTAHKHSAPSSTATQKATSGGIFSVARQEQDIGAQLTSLMRTK